MSRGAVQYDYTNLDAAHALWSSSRKAHRDARVSVGRLLHEFILVNLRKHDALGEGQRRAHGATRRVLVGQATERLGLDDSTVNDLIRTAMTVDLLSDGGELGDLSYSSIRAFRLVVARKTHAGTTVSRVSASGRDDSAALPSSVEEWQVKPTAAAVAVETFRRAVAESWDSARVIEALRGHGRRKYNSPTRDARVSADDDEDAPPTSAGLDLANVVRSASPGDAADLIAGLLENAPDKRAVAVALVSRLQHLLQRPQLTRRV